MSKLGDDLIQSLKEAVAHTKGNAPGTEHSPDSARGADGHADKAVHLEATESAGQSERGSPRKTM